MFKPFIVAVSIHHPFIGDKMQANEKCSERLDLRITPTMKKNLKRDAKKHHRVLSNHIKFLLRKYN